MKPKFKYGRGYIIDYYVREITFDMVQFPIIRRVFPRLLANDIVPVQPMIWPIEYEIITYFKKKKFKYGK